MSKTILSYQLRGRLQFTVHLVFLHKQVEEIQMIV
jgi:hypothetical protein